MSDERRTTPASSVLNYSDRILDLLVVGHFLLSVGVAFVFNDSSGFLRFSYPIITAQLCLAGFVAVHYPFRLPTRLVWIFSSPVFIWLAVVMGKYVDHLWNRSFDYTDADAAYFEFASRTIIVYLATVTFSLLPDWKGWRLQQRSNISRHGMRLLEFFVLSVVACLALTLLRNILPAKAAEHVKLDVRPEVLAKLAADVGYCLLACVPLIWICLLRGRTVAILAVVAWCLFILAILRLDADWYTPAILVIVVTSVIIRIAGFELRRAAIPNVAAPAE